MRLIAFRKALSCIIQEAKLFHSKTWLVMKLTIVLLIALCLQVQAKGYGQDISLSVQNVSLERVLRKITKQTGYHLVYREEWIRLAEKVSLTLTNVSVTEALDACFKDQPLTYELISKTIVIKKIETPPRSLPVIEQQDIIVVGRVFDDNGNPLANVSIVIKGSTKGVSSSADGTFSISVPSRNGVLVFSYVGMEVKEVVIPESGTIDVVLNPVVNAMDDVVVVAYGSQKKITVTGAIASISTREIKQSPAANLAVTLAGRLPGLTALQRSGEPGRDATALFLRGIGTLNGTAPIILVDGVEREMTYIDPNEVENVTILKDASSTALFGVRGANGVILVTTKRGASGKPSIGLTYEYGLQGFTRTPSMLNSYDWARLKNEAWANDNPGVDPDDPVNQPPYSEYALDRFMYQEYPEAYPNNNWQKMLINDYVAQKRYNLNLSGGSEYVQYFVNVGFLDQGGQWKVDPGVTDYDPSSFLTHLAVPGAILNFFTAGMKWVMF